MLMHDTQAHHICNEHVVSAQHHLPIYPVENESKLFSWTTSLVLVS